MDTAIHSFAWHASLENLVGVITRNNRLEVCELVQASCMAVSPLDDLVICRNGSLSLLKRVADDDSRDRRTLHPDLASVFCQRALASYGFNVSFPPFVDLGLIFPNSNESYYVSHILSFQNEVNIRMARESGDIHLEHFWVFIENVLK
jgi:hypothetical protein